MEVIKFDLDGHVDSKGIEYIGEAVLQDDGKWHVLANIGGALCLVEIELTFPIDIERTD